ncbi:MAG TPA: HAMP domain-containing sensor histidine kinase [Planctomycetota bacterium]|jgi:signal transduction histidine kinase
MDALKSTSIEITPEQLEELRGICSRLAYLSGGSLPPKLESAGELISAIALLTDICGKRLQRGRHDGASARDAQNQDLERLKARFVRNVSHELRTPLACIDGFARALLQMEKSAQLAAPEIRQQFLSIISQEAQRLGKMVEDVLDLSEVEAHRRQRTPALFSAQSLIDQAVRSLPGFQIAVHVNSEQGPSIYADHSMILEALLELLVNANKFSSGQSIDLGAETVIIGPDRSTQATDSGMQRRVLSATQIYVRDRGIGIPGDELQQVFDKFYRVELVATSYPGTGVGLALVRALIAQNHGQVWAESKLGAGSTFYVLLPNHPPGQ